jgi:hypothetical protein
LVDKALGDYRLCASDTYALGEVKVTYVGTRARSLPPTISAMEVKKLIVRGDQVFLAFIVTPTKQAKKNLEDIHVVYEYPDVFSSDYFGLPP